MPPTVPAQLDLPATQPGGSSTTSDSEGGFKGSKGRGVARRGGHTRLRLHDGQQDRVRPDEKRKKAISEQRHVKGRLASITKTTTNQTCAWGGVWPCVRGADVLERRHRLVSLREDGVLQSRGKRLSTRDPAARHRTVSWGRGVVGGLAKGNTGMLHGHLWAEAGEPATKSADLLEEPGGRRGSSCRRSCRRIPSKRELQHGQVERQRPVRGCMRGVVSI